MKMQQAIETFNQILEQTEKDLAIAEKVIALAKSYREREERHELECRLWAEHWSGQLWSPWFAYRVRYTSFPAASNPVLIQEVVCLEDAVDIIRGGPGCEVTAVDVSGTVDTLNIGAFLDAKKMDWVTSETESQSFYHRTIYVGAGFYVNIPAIELRSPDCLPPGDLPRFMDLCTAEIDYGGDPQWFSLMHSLTPSAAEAMTPAEVVEHKNHESIPF